MKVEQQGFYLPVEGGECFCIYRRPRDVDPSRTVLHLPAFGDEMNKARAMTARASRAFAEHGFGVLQIDLHGCGDSSGEHADATLSRWCDNALCAIDWLRVRSRAGASPWLWSLRAGALLVSRLLGQAAPDAPLLLWQPVLSGASQLNQLLRQKLAGGLLDMADERGGMRALRESLKNGETIEIGGYAISAALAREFEQATFEIPADYAGRVEWFEVTSSPAQALSPHARTKVASLRSAGVQVTAMSIEGPGFWQSTEIERCDSLIQASANAIAGCIHGVSRDTAVI